MGIREICIGYGQTEASPIITFTSVDDPIEVRVGTVGHPIPGLEVKLVELGDRRGRRGRARRASYVCAGHCVMPGYYNNPEATARAIDSAGWLHTGDLARSRDDGNYRIVGRSKEMIIRGGENIYPAEIEEFLHRHPSIAEVAVAGVPDAKYGEVVAAWVVPKAGATLTPDELKRYCRDQIAYFKIPQYVDDRRPASADRHRQDPQACAQGAGDRRPGPGRGGPDRDGVSVLRIYGGDQIPVRFATQTVSAVHRPRRLAFGDRMQPFSDCTRRDRYCGEHRCNGNCRLRAPPFSSGGQWSGQFGKLPGSWCDVQD